jgi:hypothetical protein
MRILSGLAAVAFVVSGMGFTPAAAWEMSGKKMLVAHTKDGKDIVIGSVTFTPDGDKSKFAIDLDQSVMKEFFLSMTKFRCLDGAEIQCFVPFPYKIPHTASPTNLTWLEHSLLFFWKKPNDYGAKLGNGLYYALKLTDKGLVGAPEAIDLDKIASPPADMTKPPYTPADRDPIEPGTRYVDSLRIE